MFPFLTNFTNRLSYNNSPISQSYFPASPLRLLTSAFTKSLFYNSVSYTLSRTDRLVSANASHLVEGGAF